MDTQEQRKLRFLGVEIPSVSFNSKSKIADKDYEINVELEPKLFFAKGDSNSYFILMQVSLSINELFELSLHAVGRFRFDGDELSSEDRKKMINANSTAIMFPYIRSFITTFTANLGIFEKPLILPPRFFSGEMDTLTDEVATKTPKKKSTKKLKP